MKKTYISPATNAINVHFEGVIAASRDTGVSVDRNSSIANQNDLLSGKKDYSSEIWGE
ncbi:MAG: hypothetical protein PUB53_02915 [Bacteroidales bacterium]|nr:hypothetical protein [Bacteroidales bacterium]